MPSCFVALRRHSPLFVAFKTKLTSQLRLLSDRFVPSTSSRIRRLFSLGEGKSPRGTDNKPGMNADSHESLVEGKLPEVPEGAHRMHTARAFIWGSRKHKTTTLDEEKTVSTLSPS